MTQPPYGPPPPGWQPPPMPPRRPRPRIVWFFVGGALVVLAPLVFAGALFTVLRPLTQEDAVFAAGSGPVRLDLPAGEERALFSDSGVAANCSATDGAGNQLEMRPVTGEFTYNEWTAVSRFDTGDGDVTVECGGIEPPVEYRIAQLPSTGGFIAGIAVGVIVPILLFLAGVITLIVVGIRYATGAPRQPTG